MSSADPALGPLRHALHHAAHLLPAQNPLERFVHHNTLHAFEELPFEQAVEVAARTYGARPWMPEAAGRRALGAGRIRAELLDAVVAERLDGGPLPGLELDRATLGARVVAHGLRDAEGDELAWILNESPALRELPADLPEPARAALLRLGPPARVLPALWAACREKVRAEPAPAVAPPLRPRDRLVAAGADDPDALVHPVLIGLLGAFLDQGVAGWPLSGRELGLWPAFIALVGGEADSPLQPWRRRLRARLDALGGLDVEALALGLLRDAGLDGAIGPAVEQTLLALRGWGGMFARAEQRPDLMPERAVPARLDELLAVRLLLDEAAAHHVLDGMGIADGTLAPRLAALPAPRPAPAADRAWTLFQVMRLAGAGPETLSTPGLPAALLALADALPAARRGLLLQLALERSYRDHLLDAVAAWDGDLDPDPRLQLIACIDDREESLRRHLEEQDPGVETFGAAGFFGVAIRYKGLDQGRAAPLCPAPVTPRHHLAERPRPASKAALEALQRDRKRWGRAREVLGGLHTHGALGSGVLSLAGWVSLLPFTSQLLAPRLHAKWAARREGPPTELALHRADPDARTADGLLPGYTEAEMAGVVGTLLEDIGLVRRFAPLVVVLGHGSHSANNPYTAAYNCGACGGGQGGPNARAFAAMANRPGVRALLRDRGVHVPDGTWFVGAYHDTADDRVDVYDLVDLPDSHKAEMERTFALLREARERNAHERCRRFESAGLGLSQARALHHVEARAEDLAQPRPELGHATNAVCFVGRRRWSRGLFLDRRAFLQSYDPDIDPDGAVLGRILAAVGPVGAGISLEYFFSFLDPERYGADTKLPQNPAGYLGLMDGAASDLRTGLPWQMVEIHEPMRLLLVIEATAEVVGRVVGRLPAVARLVHNGWVQVALRHPETGAVSVLEGGAFRPWAPPADPLPVVPRSVDWYRGRRDHLPIARVRAGLVRSAS